MEKTNEQRIANLEDQVRSLQTTRHYPNRDCFSYEDVAKMAGCSISKIRLDESKGKIKARYPNAKKRFSPQDVDAWLRGRGKA